MGLVLMLLGLLAWQAPALALCDAIHPVPEFYVGDNVPASPTYDSKCTHYDIESAISAATCSYGTKIFITKEHTYTGQHITIADKNVTLIARGDGDTCGPATLVVCNTVCPPPPTSPLLTIGGGSQSIFAISGTSNVTLRYLDISGAQVSSTNGGGILFGGQGSLTLDTSWVRGNTANYGGGIFMGNVGTGNPTQLNLLAYTQILSNTARDSGGGIFIQGNSVLTAVQPHTQINGNVAQGNDSGTGYGGGINVVGPAVANIGSPDDNGISVIADNSAEYGGGIAITVPGNSSKKDARVRLFSTDAAQPIGIKHNTATHTGGGIFLKPFVSTDPVVNFVTLDAWDYRIADNLAQEGAAIYADGDSAVLGDSLGSNVFLGGDPSENFPAALGAVACTNSNLCNTLNGNVASDAGGHLQSAILIQSNGGTALNKGGLRASRFSMRDNQVAHLIRLVGDHTHANLSECLIAHNGLDAEPPIYTDQLLYATGNDTPITIDSCTFANDLIGSAYVIHTESDLSLSNSIIAEPGTLALDYSGNPANRAVNYVLSNDVTTLPGTGVIPGAPTFFDQAGGDYHLQPSSLGVDFAPATVGIDLDGNPRSVDLPSIANVAGTHDLGAYELQNLFHECGAADSIYCNGFDH